MRTLVFGATLVTAFLFPVAPASAQCCGGQAPGADHAAHAAPAPASAAHACCGTHDMSAAAPMACCDGAMAALPPDDPAVAAAGLGLAAAVPVKYMDITFRDPVRVGQAVLMGRYVIEHDDDRMARGEPCTYIYDANDRRMPVVTFHCEHLERPVAPNGTVVLAPSAYPAIKTLKEFQFGGESAAHGAPAVR